ncbi:Hypothetical predicted protein [Pelobates cultripes]|uniref:exodeoxyribonuclease III n=1 Tax=Pelobates cultripes TaxID=61616 RepID=A0AAD1RGG7_PELCU|nr:Hypothetical predicted protein [Pelobates cultripes]
MPTPGIDRYAREDLSIVTYNVHGLNVREKRSRLLRDLKHYKTSIAFLQETHFQEGRAPALKDRYFRQGYFSNNPDRRTLGVGILFSNQIPYVERATLRCKQGRYIFTKGTILDQTYTFANLYSPNTKQHLFLRTALNTLMKFTEGTLIVGGDLNLPLHAEQDSTAKHGATPDNRNARTLRTIHYHQLADCWRALHPSTPTQATIALSKEIAALETKHKRTLDAETYRDLTVKREQLSTLLNRSIQRSYQHFKHIIHEHGNKCGRLLANLLKQRKSQLYIPKIKGPPTTTLTSPGPNSVRVPHLLPRTIPSTSRHTRGTTPPQTRGDPEILRYSKRNQTREHRPRKPGNSHLN